MHTEPPNAPEVEQALLGGLQLYPAELANHPTIDEDWFYYEQHRRIFKVLKRLITSKLPIDSATLSVHLKNSEDLVHLASCVAKASTSVAIEHHVDILRQQHRARQLIDKSALAANCAARGELTDAESVLTELVSSRPTNGTLPFADLDQWWLVPDREWLFYRMIPRNEVTVISSPGGAGKSFFALGLAVSAVTGRDIFGSFQINGRHKVLYLSGEDDAREVRRRLTTYADTYFHGSDYLYTSVMERLRLIAAHSKPFLDPEGRSFVESPYFYQVVAAAQQERPSLIVVDTLRKHLGAASENDNAVVGYLMELFGRLARACNAAVVVLHHANKASGEHDESRTGDVRGASSVVDEARSVYIARRTQDGFQLTHMKSNYGPVGTEVTFEYTQDPVCLRQVSVYTPGATSVEDVARRFADWVSKNSGVVGYAGLKKGRYAGLSKDWNVKPGELFSAAEYAHRKCWILEEERTTSGHRKQQVFVAGLTPTAPMPQYEEPEPDPEPFYEECEQEDLF